MYTESELREFIVEAKKSTYAGKGERAPSSRLQSIDLPYEKGAFKYLDSFAGEVDFIGEEVVWYESIPVWGMNYYGILLKKAPEEFSDFLKSSLSLVCIESPFRGPAYYTEGQLEYRCSWDGDLDFFSGHEEIFYLGELIYKLLFHGGKLKTRL